MTFPDIEAILDALEAALVSADTPLFDAARQSWQPVGLHPEVRNAWEARERFRPPAAGRLVMPPLPEPGVVEDEELARSPCGVGRSQNGRRPRSESAA